VPAQVLKERLVLTGFSDGKHLGHWWGDDAVAAPPEALRMAVGQVGIVPFDAEPLKRQHMLRQTPRATEPAWRSLICSMAYIPHTLSRMEPKEQAAQLPEKRGVYMFKDAVDQVIYVGKVRSLRNRDKNRKTAGDSSR
jgi:hypothetical protein